MQSAHLLRCVEAAQSARGELPQGGILVGFGEDAPVSVWKPRLLPNADLRALPLSPQEGFVASRLDGMTSVQQLVQITGLSAPSVEEALARLVAHGALEANPFAASGRPEVPPAPEVASNEEEAGPESDAAPAEAQDQAGTHRKLYETTLHSLPVDERVGCARTATEPQLSALCYDPMPAVIKVLLENPAVGLSQARLIAAHHRTAVGLEALAARASFAADLTVRRWLVRNPQLPVGLFRRLYAGRRLLEQFQLTVSRELPEQNRRAAREVMRQRFGGGPAEERVELILKTEGRCLTALTGIPIDGKTASLLCGRPFHSTVLVQNIARWSAAPPVLIAHLMRQDLVRRSPMLRTMLQRHPNAPSEPRGRV
jgi:hypothetical protein